MTEEEYEKWKQESNKFLEEEKLKNSKLSQQEVFRNGVDFTLKYIFKHFDVFSRNKDWNEGRPMTQMSGFFWELYDGFVQCYNDKEVK